MSLAGLATFNKQAVKLVLGAPRYVISGTRHFQQASRQISVGSAQVCHKRDLPLSTSQPSNHCKEHPGMSLAGLATFNKQAVKLVPGAPKYVKGLYLIIFISATSGTRNFH